MKRGEPNREANIWVARAVPLFLLGIIGYGCWVITKLLCVDYLLRPRLSAFPQPQVRPAIAILVICYILLPLVLVCYARLIFVVTRNPGLVPRGPQWYIEQSTKQRSQRRRGRGRHSGNIEKSKCFEADSSEEKNASEAAAKTIALDVELKVENFWQRDIFTCGYDGRPAFCSTCYNWKPDRAHHCSELDRCVLKMDHFCPWVGGVVGETSFKFFVQFTFWAALLCLHILVSISYYLAQRRRVEGVVNVHWAVILGISGLFFIFSAGMCTSSLQFAFINSTTIENLSRKRKVWYLAVWIPDHLLRDIEERGRSNLRLITYPRPPAEQFQMLEQSGAEMSSRGAEDNSTSPSTSQATQALRTFAILETAPGTNPFDLGYKQNFLDIMGTNLYEWLLPIRLSPCVRHDSGESFYRLNSAVDQLKREARIVDDGSTSQKQTRRKRSKHRRKKSSSRRRSQSQKDGDRG